LHRLAQNTSCVTQSYPTIFAFRKVLSSASSKHKQQKSDSLSSDLKAIAVLKEPALASEE